MSLITTVEALRALYNPAGARSVKKDLPQLDTHALRFIALSPLVVISSGHAQHGGLDASPRGGAPGFVKAPDAHTLLLPDAPGNNRLDTLENIVGHGAAGAPIGLLFLVPGVDETLRVNGRAWVSISDDERSQCAEPHRLPKLAIRVRVQSSYLHCAKAFMRSKLWDPAHQVQRSALPSMGEMLRDQIRAFHGEDTVAETQQEMLVRYQQTL